MRVEMVPGYVLHARPWRETSLLLDLWTQSGRLSAIARGARRPGSGQRSALQPLGALSLSWVGRGEIKTLTHVDYYGRAGQATDADHAGAGAVPGGYAGWQSEAIYCGFYANELLVRTVLPGEPQPELFAAYRRLLEQLAALNEPVQRAALERLLREFELALLQQLGYGLDLGYTGAGEPVSGGKHYEFRHGEGLCAVRGGATSSLPGEHIQAFAQGDMQDERVRRSARNLLRLALRPLLGEQPLYSRQLFRGQA